MKLEELKALCDAASPGPWKPFQTDQTHESLLEGIAAMLAKGGPAFVYLTCPIKHQEDETEMTVAQIGNGANRNANAAFIAAARAALPKLIAVVEAAKAAREELDAFYLKAKLEAGVYTISEDDHILWFARDEIDRALAALEA